MIEGLIPDNTHNRAVLDLLFILAEWHAIAKLRLHTTSTVASLRDLTRMFGIRMRHFANHICPQYDTRELPGETVARVRRITKQRVKQGEAGAPTSTAKNVKHFKLATYKLHAMGDYVDQIVQFGTTDSYSTQSVR